MTPGCSGHEVPGWLSDLRQRPTRPAGAGNINFIPATGNNTAFGTTVANQGSATITQVTTAYTDASNTFDPGGRLGQLVFRLNW